MILISCQFMKFGNNEYKLLGVLGVRGRGQFLLVKLIFCSYHLSSTFNMNGNWGGLCDGMWTLQSQ